MELRVWVDGTQRVVCGVKLTTTCQEIVFALAHATQQAGRFTMIERWRNNERLLSPNEQPLVTLQRWGDHMNEVEFILRKTSTEVPTHSQMPQLQQQQQQAQQQQQQQSQQQPQTQPQRTNQPPAVPAKPRVMGQIAPMTNLNMPPHQQLQPVNNAQMNYYHPHPHPLQNQSPLSSLYQNNLRPRHPPGYLDYMEAMASRNSLTQPPPMLNANPVAYAQQSQHAQGNIFQRSFDPHPHPMPQQQQQPLPPPNQQQQMYQHLQRNGSSSVSLGSTNNLYRYSSNGQLPPQPQHGTYDRGSQDLPIITNNGMRNANSARPKLTDSNGLIINRGSAVNVRLHPSSSQTNITSQTSTTTITPTSNDRSHDSSSLQNTSTTSDNGPSVSQMGHDMLKVIEEQKKVLIQSKNELNELDNDQEYWELRQNSEQTELINRIEKEIRQLEELWKENQAQIRKLENQDFEKELQELKSEQVKMEQELEKQKGKLTRCENDIILCKTKIEELQGELANLELESEDSSSSSSSSSGEREEEAYLDVVNKTNSSNETVKTDDDSIQSDQISMLPNGSVHNNDDQSSKETKSSEDEDFEEDSGGDVSDDLNLPSSDSKPRSAKDVAYVDKRGLISGIRSLKLDKSRALNRQAETTIRSTENINAVSNSTSSITSTKDKTTSINNNILDQRCSETNGQYSEKTANNNKFEFLMTL